MLKFQMTYGQIEHKLDSTSFATEVYTQEYQAVSLISLLLFCSHFKTEQYNGGLIKKATPPIVLGLVDSKISFLETDPET